MKTILVLCALTSAALATTPILVRVTPAQLAARQQDTLLAKLEKPAAVKVKGAKPNSQSITKQSIILHDGVNWTIVPKSAVIYLPAALQSRVDVKPVGTLLSWKDFLTKNGSWITTNDVSFDQASGFIPLDSERVAFWTKQDKIVIATHQATPISIKITPSSQTASK